MIHNPQHRIAKMMREIRAFDPIAIHTNADRWSKRPHAAWILIASRIRPVDRRTVIASLVVMASQKPERCVRQALKQIRKIGGKA